MNNSWNLQVKKQYLNNKFNNNSNSNFCNNNRIKCNYQIAKDQGYVNSVCPIHLNNSIMNQLKLVDLKINQKKLLNF